jgi:hypothetical protein
MSETQSDQVMQIMRAEYAVLDDAGDIIIKPSLLAARTKKKLDPDDRAPTLVAYCAVLELRQLARSLCRQRSPTEEISLSGQVELFDGQLQKRYPAMREDEEGYVLRAHLTLHERRTIEARMSAAAVSLGRHVDAFRAETAEMLRSGAFAEAA